MIPADITQLGIAGLTLGILFFIVKYFVGALNSKDTYLESNNVRTEALIKDFQAHVELCNTNFLKNSQITSRALDKLSKVVSENTLALKKNKPAVEENTGAVDKNTEMVDKSTNGNGK